MTKALTKEASIKILITIILMVGIILGCGYLENFLNRDKIKSFYAHRKLTIGKVISTEIRGFKGVMAYNKYNFTVNGKIYPGEFKTIAGGELFLGKSFAVAYDSLNPNDFNMMLVFPTDYKQCNVKFPDSLEWVLPYR